MDAFFVKRAFDAYINDVTKTKPEQREFLLRHPRRHIAEENCLREHKLAQLKMGLRYQRKHVQQLVMAAANVFCQCAINAKMKELMTSAELKRHETKAGELADTQAMVDDMAKEALSTAVKKSMYTGNNASKESLTTERGLGHRGSDGPTVQPSGGNSGSPGTNG